MQGTGMRSALSALAALANMTAGGWNGFGEVAPSSGSVKRTGLTQLCASTCDFAHPCAAL